MTNNRAWLVPMAGLIALTGCGLSVHTPTTHSVETTPITVTSPTFRDGNAMPARLVCTRVGGQGRTPALRWSVPSGKIRGYAIVADDPDAPFVHWVLFNIDPTTTELLENKLPAGAREAKNSAEQTKYAAPCPGKGDEHRYRFTVYALDQPVPLQAGAGLDDTLAAIADRTVARGRLTGKFGIT